MAKPIKSIIKGVQITDEDLIMRLVPKTVTDEDLPDNEILVLD